MTDVTKVTIAAVDQASEVFARVQTSAEKLQKSFGALAAFFTTGATVGYFTHLVQGATDAAEAINNLSQKTGIAVQALSTLDYAAKLRGATTDDLARGVKTLAQRMTEANDVTSKSGQIMQALGVNLASGPQKAIETLADRFRSLEDGTTKTALAVELFGKGGMALIPMLNEGSEGLRRLRDEAEALGLAYGPEFARDAAQFNDNLKAIKSTSEALGLRLAQTLMPQLLDISGAMKEAAKDGGLLYTLWIGMGGVAANLFGKPAQSDLQIYTKQVEVLTEKYQQLHLALMESDFRTKGGQDGLRIIVDQIKETQAALTLARELMQAYRGVYGDQASRTAQQGQRLGGDSKDSALEKRLAALLAGHKAINAEQAVGLDLLVKLEKENEKLGEELTGQTDQLNVQNTALELQKDKYKGISPFMLGMIYANAAIADWQKKQLETIKFLNEEHQKELDFAQKKGQLEEQISNEWADRTRDLENELKTTGLSASERQKLLLTLKAQEDIQAVIDNPSAVRDINAELEKQVGIIDDIAAAEKQLSIWNELGDKMSQFFVDLVEHGKSAFSHLRDTLKGFLADMIGLFAKRWILQLGASAVGGTTGAALAGQAATAGQGSIAGSLLSAGGSFASDTLGLGSILGGQLTAGLSANLATLNIAMTAGVDAVGGFATALGAAIPVIGTIVAVGAILYSIFSKPGGGPKQQGAWAGAFGPTGAFLGALNGPGITNITGDNQQAAQAEQLGRNMASGFYGELNNLGGKTGGLSFGTAFSMDPNGTAPSFVHTSVLDAAGNTIFQQRNDQVGRDQQSVTAEIQLQSQRAILAGLQSATFTGEVGETLSKILHMASADTGTQEQIQNVIGLAEDFKKLSDTIENLSRSPLENLKHQLGTLKDNISDASDAFTAALKSGDIAQIRTAEASLTQAVQARYAFEMNAITQLRDAIRQIEEQAYQFSIDIANRINSVGGNVDVGAIAMGRAGTLRDRVAAGTEPLDYQSQDLQGYVSAIDTWYQAKKGAIEQQIAAEQQAAQAIANAQKSAVQGEIAALQQQLNVAQQFQAVVEKTGQMIQQMQLTASNPLSTFGRLGIAGQNVDALQQAYESATGTARTDAANKLVDALQQRLALASQAYDRPSSAYQSVYNQTIAELTKIQGDAQDAASQTLTLQSRIADLQAQSNALSNVGNQISAASQAKLDALDQEALGYYTWAQEHGAQIYEQARQQHLEQLNAITGGMDVDLYVAKLTDQQVSLLTQIRDGIRDFANGGTGGPVTVNVTVNPPAGSSPADIGDAVMKAIVERAPVVKRILARS